MKHNPLGELVEATNDTGIYRYPPRQSISLTRGKPRKKEARAVRALFKKGKKSNKTFDLEAQLKEAREYALAIIDRYEDRHPEQKKLERKFEREWKRYREAWKRDPETAKKLYPKTIPPDVGFPRAPSKKEGIPDNVKRQLEYAKMIDAYCDIVQRALAESHKVLAYVYWIGRYYEALRVCQVEHIAARERNVMKGRRAGHATQHGTREAKDARWRAFQEALDTLSAKNPSRSLTALRKDIARMNRVSFKTIERHTTDQRKN